MNTLPGLTENIIKKHLEKSRNTTIGHLHMKIQGLKSTIEKPPDIDLEDKSKTNVVFCATVDMSITQIYVDAFPIHQVHEKIPFMSFMYMIVIPS